MAFAKNVVIEAGSGNFLKTPPGQTKVRIVSEVVKMWKDFDGKKLYLTEDGAKTNPEAKVRYAMWVIDRADNEIKMWECSGGIIKDIQALSENTEYSFDGLPPYDLIINRVGTTQQDTRYSLTPARQNTVLTEFEAKAVAAQQALILFLRETAEDKEAVPML